VRVPGAGPRATGDTSGAPWGVPTLARASSRGPRSAAPRQARDMIASALDALRPLGVPYTSLTGCGYARRGLYLEAGG